MGLTPAACRVNALEGERLQRREGIGEKGGEWSRRRAFSSEESWGRIAGKMI